MQHGASTAPLTKEQLAYSEDLKERDQAREQLRADVQAGFEELARGEGRAYDMTSGRKLAERIRSRGRAARAKTS